MIVPIDKSNDYINEDIMGYGTHIDEKIFSIQSFSELLQFQRNQSAGLELKMKATSL